MLPYGTIHHTYIHAYWTLPMLVRAKAPRTVRALGRMRQALSLMTPGLRRTRPATRSRHHPRRPATRRGARA